MGGGERVEYQSGRRRCTIRRGSGVSGRICWERMANENGAMVDVDWERDFVFDGDWACDADCASAEVDR